MPNIDTQAHAGIHVLHQLQCVQRRWEVLVLRAVIVDGDLNVVFLYELLQARQRLRCRPGNDDRNTRDLAVFELPPHVVILILGEINGARSRELYARRSVFNGSRLDLLRRGQGQVKFLHVQIGRVQLLHKADHVGSAELTEGIAGDAQANRGRRRSVGGREPKAQRRLHIESCSRSNSSGPSQEVSAACLWAHVYATSSRRIEESDCCERLSRESRAELNDSSPRQSTTFIPCKSFQYGRKALHDAIELSQHKSFCYNTTSLARKMLSQEQTKWRIGVIVGRLSARGLLRSEEHTSELQSP